MSTTKNYQLRGYQLSHPDKIIYPELDITKLQIAEYYTTIQDWIMPHIANRPLALVRCPEQVHGECFFQKHLNHEMPGLFQDDVYIYLKKFIGLLSLVQLNVLEIHQWGCHVKQLEKPDMLVFDLDPAPQLPWIKVIQAAHMLREELATLSLVSFVKTTGGKGLHIVVPIKPQYTWEEAKTFAHALVDYLVGTYPEKFIGVMTKSKRHGKIFIDYLRNGRGATAVAPYSTRAKETAAVSTPLSWDELTSRIKSDTFTIKNLPKRLQRLKCDPWEDFFNIKQSLRLNSYK